MVFIMAWRNIWRNPTRSILVMLSVIIGLWAGVFTMAFVKGMYTQHLKNSIENYFSHYQIHHSEFATDKDVSKYLNVNESQLKQLLTDNRIKGISPRTVTQVMMASPINALGVNAIGINPALENSVTKINERITEGETISKEKLNGILIGEKVAKKLKVKLKNKVVLSFQLASGDIVSGAFKIAGIFKSSNSAFDESNVYVNALQIQKLSGLDSNSYHEVAVFLSDNKYLNEIRPVLTSSFKNTLVQNWMQLAPELDLVINSFDLYMYIFIGIILLALCFGIINTMLMAVLERVREIGMLMAIGMNKPRVFVMIILETVLLSLAGSPIGFLISYLTVYYFSYTGIDLSMFSQGLSSYGFVSVIYPSLEVDFYLDIYLMTFTAALLASLYPAFKALRLKPVEAIRKI